MSKKIKFIELGEIVKEAYTGTLITKAQISSDGIPCIRYGEIYTSYDISCKEVISKAQLEEGNKKYRYCDKNDLLITKVGETISEIAKPLAYVGEQKILVDSATIVLSHDQNAKYLAYALSTENVKKQKMRLFNQGPAIANVRIDQVLKLKIPLPSLEQQEKIAKWLETFSSLERQLERHKTQYRYYLNRLMRGGQLTELKKIIKEAFSGTLITKSQITTEGTPCIRYGEIYTSYDIWCEAPASHITLETGKKYKYCEKNDLLITKIGESISEIAKPLAYVGEKLVAIDSNTTLLKHNQNAKYLSYALSTDSIKKQKQHICNISPITISVNLKQISKLQIPLPSLDKQEKIANWLDRFRELTENISKGLPREILLLKQQSRYYREKLIG